MPRIFLFRGKTVEELQAMKVDDFAKLLESRQRRALKRNSIQVKELEAKIDAVKKKDPKKLIKTRTREAVILPSWLGLNIAVHNGKEYKQLAIGPEMLGHRLGDFVFSTKRVMHSAPGIRATRGSKFLAVK